MKALALLILAAATVAAVFYFSRDADGQSFPFGIQQQGCGGCADGSKDFGDTEFLHAEGTLSRIPFMWLSKYPADIGVRWMRLEVTADVAAVWLISQPSSQSELVMFGETRVLCLASYGGARAAIMVRGAGYASVTLVDGDSGCSPGYIP